MSTFFENGSGTPGGLTATSDTVTSEGSFFENVQGSGTPVPLTQPFEGVLAHSDAQIGHVVVDNPVTTVTIGAMPPISGGVNVLNLPPVQQVAVNNYPANQPVTLTNPVADQLVHGTVGVNNWPSVQNVTLTGLSQVLATLGAGTEHVGSVSIDGAVNTSTNVLNWPSSFQVSNLPQTQQIQGSVSVTNQQPFPAGFKVTNDDGSAIPVKITGGQSSFSGSLSAGSAHIGSVGVDGLIKLDDSTPIRVEVTNQVSTSGGTSSGGTFDGNVTVQNTSDKPVPVQIVGGQSSFNGSLSAGTAHIGSVNLDQPVQIDGSTPLNVSFPASQTVNGTIHAIIDNLPSVQTVHVDNQVTEISVTNTPSVNVTNWPAVQTVNCANSNVAVTSLPAVTLASNSVSVSGGQISINNPSTAPVNVTQVGTSTVQLASNIVQLASNAVSVSGNVSLTGATFVTHTSEPFPAAALNVDLPMGSYMGPYGGKDVDSTKIVSWATRVAGLRVGVVDGNGRQYGVINGLPLVTKLDSGIANTSATDSSNYSLGSQQAPMFVQTAFGSPFTVSGTVSLSSNVVTVANTITAAITSLPAITLASNAVTVSGTVGISGTVPVSIASAVSTNATITNASLPVTQSGSWAVNSTIQNASLPVTQSGTWNVTTTSSVKGSTNVADAIPVNIVAGGSAGGGSSFSGQLTQGGSNVSTTNPLPVATQGVNYYEVSTATASGATWNTTVRTTPGAGLIYMLHLTSSGAMGVINVQQSPDNATWTTVKSIAATYAAASNVVIAVDAVATYYRVQITSQAANNVFTTYQSFAVQTIDAVGAVSISGSPTIASVASVGTQTNTTSTALAANAVSTGSAISAISTGTYSNFSATAYSDQAGLLRIEMSFDGTTYVKATPDLVVIGGVPATLTVPFATWFYRAVFVNGPTAQTLFRMTTFASKTGA